ncbi:MAG TPA: hypothetical protein V6D05_14090 [Stenomitos sp.]
MRRANFRLTAALAFLLVAGCGSASPLPAPSQSVGLPPANPLSPVEGIGVALAPPTPYRYLAFTACRDGDLAGSLFLWDAALQDVFILNGALAGLGPLSKAVHEPKDCAAIVQLNPRAFGPGKVLLSFGPKVLVYDPATEERITAATDGRSLALGGPKAVVSSDGKLLAYVSCRGTLVLKPTDPVYSTKTRELTKLAAEIAALADRKGYGGVIKDFDLSGDGTCLILNIDGAVYFYDVLHPRLYQVAPLDGTALAGLGDGFGHVAISPDGTLVACTIIGQRLLVFDRKSGHIDTVPYANLGGTLNDRVLVFDPLFGLDGRSLYFETWVGGTFKVWCYDVMTETLRTLAILNDVLGENLDDILVSEPDLGG